MTKLRHATANVGPETVHPTQIRISQGKRRTALAAAAVALIASACGSTHSVQGAPAGGSGTKTTQKPATGKPVLVYDITDASGVPSITTTKEFFTGAQAAENYINDQLGGIGGRKVQVVTCDSQFSPAATLTCAQKAVVAHATAEAGLTVSLATNGLNLLSQHDIVSISSPTNQLDTTNPDGAGVTGGGITQIPVAVTYAAQTMHAKSAVFVGTDIPVGRGYYGNFQTFAKKYGIKISAVFIPPTSTDDTPYISQAVEQKPSVIFFWGNPQDYRILQTLNYPTSRTINQGGQIDASAFNEAPAAENGALYTDEMDSYSDTSNPDIVAYLAAMKKYEGSNGQGEFAQIGFAQIMAVYNAGEKIGASALDAQTLHAYLTTTKNLPVFGGATEDNALSPKAYPAIRVPFSHLVKYSNGALVNLGGWIDPFDSSHDYPLK